MNLKDLVTVFYHDLTVLFFVVVVLLFYIYIYNKSLVDAMSKKEKKKWMY